MENKNKNINKNIKEITYIPDVFAAGTCLFLSGKFGKYLLTLNYDCENNILDIYAVAQAVYRIRRQKVESYYSYYKTNRINRYEKLNESAERRERWHSLLRNIVSDFIKTCCKDAADLRLINIQNPTMIQEEERFRNKYEYRFYHFFARELQGCFNTALATVKRPSPAYASFKVCLN